MTPALGRVWLAAAGASLGALYGCGHQPGWLPILALVAGAGMLLRRRAAVRLVGVAAAAFAFGSIGSMARCEPEGVLSVLAARVPACRATGHILEAAGGLGTLAALEWIDCEGFVALTGAGVVVLDGDIAEAGASFSARGWLIPLGTDSFDRARRRLGAHAQLDAVALATRPPGSGPLALAARIRGGLRTATEPLDERSAALMRGLAIGDVAALDEGTIEVFRRSGLSHLLAVSGSNVAIVVASVSSLAARLGLRARLFLSSLALGLFVLIVGPDPSVLRATAMGGIGLAVIAFGARAEPLHALGIAVTVVVLLRPGLVYSVGLHLSVAATAGIVLWTRHLGAGLSWMKPRLLGLALAATLAAQIAVAPVLALVFGSLSVVAPAANLLAMPAVPPATILALAAGAAGSVAPGLGHLLARCGDPFAAWILWTGDLFGEVPWATVDVPEAAGWLLAVPTCCAAALALRRL